MSQCRKIIKIPKNIYALECLRYPPKAVIYDTGSTGELRNDMLGSTRILWDI